MKSVKDKKNNSAIMQNKKRVLSKKLSLDNKEIEKTAYFLWEQKGCPPNCDLENWLEAEKMLKR